MLSGDNFKIHTALHVFYKFMAWQYSQSIPRDVDNENPEISRYIKSDCDEKG